MSATATRGAGRPEGNLLTLPQTAQRLGIELRSLRRWIASGRFPAPIRNGHRWVRVPESTLNAFLQRLAQDAQRTAPPPQLAG